MFKKVCVILFFAFFLFNISFSAVSMQTVSFQGKLLDNTGAAITGTRAMAFTMYPQSFGGTAVANATWSQSVAVQNGMYAVELDASAVDLSNVNDAWMEVAVAGETLTPRIHLTSSAFALTSKHAENGSPVGTVQMFAGSTVPSGWLLCDGSTVSRTTYAALFAVLGATYGGGDGSTTFNLPDLRGMFVRGSGTNGGTVKKANGTAYAGGALGSVQPDQFQTHQHKNFWVTGASLDWNMAYTNWIDQAAGSNVGFGVGNADLFTREIVAEQRSAAPGYGDGAPRYGNETRPASMALNYIIKY